LDQDLETAYAKINLALHVRSRRADGYHVIETLFAFAEDGDVLTVTPSDGLELAIDGPFGAGLPVDDDNLVLRAAAALRSRFPIVPGAALQLQKNLPVAAGIGGGSADAAAALRLLTRHWGIAAQHPAIHEIAASLGADVPACVASLTMRGDGVGDQLTPVEAGGVSGLPLLLVNPRAPCLTSPVFRAWDGMDRGALGVGDPLALALAGRNDLELPALGLVPEIGDVLTLLAAQSGVVLTRMSGSGATCFALFEDRASCDAAHQAVVAHQPEWWALSTRIR
jgi:4-diphosphocytidyl-2-C-methyl-D-erythritol kinase